MSSTPCPRIRRERRHGAELLILENDLVRVTAWPENGAAVLGFEDVVRGIDVMWHNPLLQPPRKAPLAQPVAGCSDLYDVLDGSWFVSLPTGSFPAEFEGAAIGTHGEIRAVPFEVDVLEASPARVCVKLTGRSIRTPFELEHVWELAAGSEVLVWRETLRNRCDRDLPCAWLHHPAFGGELIDGAELRVAARTVTTYDAGRAVATQLRQGYRGDWPLVPLVAGGMRDCSRVPAPGTGMDHSVALTDLRIGWGCVWNAAWKRGFALRWNEKLFPWAWSWANSGGIKGYPLWGHGHLITLQPGTSPVGHFAEVVRSGEILTVPARGAVSTVLLSGFTDRPDEPWDLT